MKSPPRLVPLSDYQPVEPREMAERARRFSEMLQRRRSVRLFSDRPVAMEVIRDCLAASCRRR